MDFDELEPLSPTEPELEEFVGHDTEAEFLFVRRDWDETPTGPLAEPGGAIPHLPVWEEPGDAPLHAYRLLPNSPLRLVGRQSEFSSAPSVASLTLRATVSLSECAKLRAQLSHEWRTSSLVPTVEDVVVRAAARAFREVWGAEARIGLRRIDGSSEQIALVPISHGQSFRAAVEALAASPRRDSAADLVVTSFLATAVQQADPRLDAALFALTLGAEREALNGTATMLSLAYAPESVPDGVAAALLCRIRELVEAPYALLAG